MAGAEAAEFAEYLRAERERRRLTLEQVADETKIASRHLAALERGDVRNWPGGMYRRAMMRAYAESIGVDREYALKQFEQVFEPAKKPAEAPAPEPVPQPGLLQRDVLEPRMLQPRMLQPRMLQQRLVRWRPSRSQARAAALSLVAVIAFVVVWKVAASLTSTSVDSSSAITSNVANATVVASTPAASGPATNRGATSDTVAASVTSNPPVRAAASAAPIARASVAAAQSSNRQPAVVPARETAATSGASEPRTFATEGNLVVTSDPPGARVTVNGIGWGETPLTIRHIELGEKRIRLTMQGYVSQERVVRLGPERASATVRATLRERGEVTPGR